MTDDDTLETDYDQNLDSLEDSPEPERESSVQPVSNTTAKSNRGISKVIDQAVSGQPRTSVSGKQDRKGKTLYINRMVLYEAEDLVTQLKREYNPEPRQLDVDAALYYAGFPGEERSVREILEAFGYQRVD